MELELKTFIPAIVPLMQRENALTLDYGKLIASAQIPFEGGVYTLSQLTPFKQDPDDNRRRAAWEAEGRFYLDHGKELDALYDELVQVRTRQAREMGYDNYVELGYYRMGRNCYTKEDVEKFRAAVVKYLVPAAEQVVKAQARRLGKEYPLADDCTFWILQDHRSPYCRVAQETLWDWAQTTGWDVLFRFYLENGEVVAIIEQFRP